MLVSLLKQNKLIDRSVMHCACTRRRSAMTEGLDTFVSCTKMLVMADLAIPSYALGGEVHGTGYKHRGRGVARCMG